MARADEDTNGLPSPSIARLGSPAHFPAGSVLFRPGDSCAGLLVVKSGAVRVQLVSNAGRQITLYRVEPDVACAF
jgi:CRP/FNR family transcriptional regulator